MHVLTDDDVTRLVTPALARESMRDALVSAWRGELRTPPRAQVALADRSLTFTCGAHLGEWYGYRSYIAPGSERDDQLVVVHNEKSGAVRAVAVGEVLGPRRVGGIGGVAADVLAPSDAAAIALLGTGVQAWHQLWALPDRLRGLPITVYSRTPGRRAEFVSRARSDLALNVRAASAPESAVREADVVILATSSATPVIDASWITPGSYVTTLGPKQVGRAEFDPALALNADAVACDSPAQLTSYDPPNVLMGSGIEDRAVHLGAILAGDVAPSSGTRVFFSVGCAGTEAWLLAQVTQLTD